MASLFEIGKSGVQAYRQALSVTGQNIANVNTDGYNKRAADLEEIPSVQGGVTNVPDQSGLGVRVNKIRRSFDSFLSDNSRRTNSEFEKLDRFVDDLNKLENMLLPSDSDLGTFIGRFFNSLQEIASRPDNKAARSVAIENGKALANSFNSYDTQLTDFKNSANREVAQSIKEINSLVTQLAQVNKLIMSGGAKNTSPDILDARDSLLLDLSKHINFTVDYGASGEVKVRLGSSGKGNILLEKTDLSILSNVITEGRIVFTISRNGVNSNVNDLSSGLLTALRDFYDFIGNIQSEISDLATRVSRDFNEIQNNGIDLNGQRGKTMFSVNSMSPTSDITNKGSFEVELSIFDSNKIKQETMNFTYLSSKKSWSVANSSGIKTIPNNDLNFDGFKINVVGEPSDGDKFSISPSSNASKAFSFLLSDPNSLAAASRKLISSSNENTSNTELNIIGKEITSKNTIQDISEVFTSSSNPLLSSSFLKQGTIATIPSNTDSITLSSLTSQSNAIFSIFDTNVKGFSNIVINLSDDTSISISSSASDPGDGIKSVQELADVLNSGLSLDGISQHNFRKYGLYASGASGSLTITSSDASITSSSILSNGSTYTANISQLSSTDSAASKIQIFTRDGRHISGTDLTSSEIASILKESNGFLDTAEYRNDYINRDYRGIKANRISALGDYTSNFGSNISYKKQSTDDDGLFTEKLASSLSGTLTLDGSFSNSTDIDSFVTFTSSADDTGVQFKISGYDQDGLYQEELLNGGDATSVTSTKIFKSISSVSINSGTPSANLKIGLKASGYTLKILNVNDKTTSTVVPINSSAYYLKNKLDTDLAGTGIDVSAETRIYLGPLSQNTSGTFSFDLKGSNSESISINTTISADDLSGLSRQINQFTSQTGIIAVNTADFDRLVLISEDGYDIEMTNIVAPSDFSMFGVDDRFNTLTEELKIDIDNISKNNAFVKGNIKFISSLDFSTQIDNGQLISATQKLTENGFYNIEFNKTGEIVKVTPKSFDKLDDNVSGPNGKKAQAGVSKYGLSIPLSDYRIDNNDTDSLFTLSSGSGTLTLNGSLKDTKNLNSTLSISCVSDESTHYFKIVGKDSEGLTISEEIKGVTAGNIAKGSQIYQEITSINVHEISNDASTTTAGNIKIGTLGRHSIDDDDSLFEQANISSSGSITMTGTLFTSEYLGAKIKITSLEDESNKSFTISGFDGSGKAVSEVIKGSNGTISKGDQIFKKITSISVDQPTTGNIKIGTSAGDGDWSGTIDANDLNLNSTEDISLNLTNKLRQEAPTIQLIGETISSLPKENSNVQLKFEGQIYNLKMVSNEIIIQGPETDRIKARFEETITKDIDGLALSQSVTGGSSITLNGSKVSAISSGARISLTSISNESANSFTVVGTDLDGNALSEVIKGGGNGQTVIGSKIFKTITSVKPTSNTSGNIQVGIEPSYKLYITSEGTIEGDQFNLIENTSNLSFASQFGISKGNNTLLGNLALKPTVSSEKTNIPFQITVDQDGEDIDYNVKFVTDSNTSSLFASSTSVTANTTLGSPTSHTILGGKITIKTDIGGNQSSTVFTVVGKDMFGNSLTENITGSTSGNTSTGNSVFKSVTSITPGSSVGSGTVTVGHESQPVFFNTNKVINLFTSKSVTASSAFGTPATHIGYGGKIKISTSTSGNQSSTSFTVVGTDASGSSLTEVITGAVGGQSVIGSSIFKTVTSITPGSTVGSGTVEVDYILNQDVSLTPPSNISLEWSKNESGTTDTDSLFLNANTSSNTAVQFDGAITNTDDDSLFTSSTIASSGILLLNGVLSKNEDLRSKISITSVSDESAKTFTIKGYDQDGIYQTETVTGGSSNSTVNSSNTYSKIISIEASAATTGNIKIGTKAQSVDLNGSSITITSSGNEATNSFTVSGIDMFGVAQTEIIIGGNSTTVYGQKVFKSVSSITSTNAVTSGVSFGTNATGRLKITHEIGKSDFTLDENPNVQNIYGLKTQKTRVNVDNNGIINLNSQDGKPLNIGVPENSTTNTVSEQITLTNLPSEELIAVIMDSGAKKVNAQFNFLKDDISFEEPEFDIKVDSINKNKIEIFDKKYGHSISTRILDNNRVFEAIGSRFQFSEEPKLKDTFSITNNVAGTGDNRNVLSMLDLQLEKMSTQNKGNFQEIFSNTLAKVGSNVQANDLSLKAASNNKEAAESAQSEFTGVSLDDEAAHLLEFQQAYQASARILQTARELFDSLIKVV